MHARASIPTRTHASAMTGPEMRLVVWADTAAPLKAVHPDRRAGVKPEYTHTTMSFAVSSLSSAHLSMGLQAHICISSATCNSVSCNNTDISNSRATEPNPLCILYTSLPRFLQLRNSCDEIYAEAEESQSPGEIILRTAACVCGEHANAEERCSSSRIFLPSVSSTDTH